MNYQLVWEAHELLGGNASSKAHSIEQTNPSIIVVPVSSYFLPICVTWFNLASGIQGTVLMEDDWPPCTQLFHLIVEALKNKDKKGRVIISIQLWMKEQTYERHYYDHPVVSFWVWARMMNQQPTSTPLMERMLYDSVVWMNPNWVDIQFHLRNLKSYM